MSDAETRPEPSPRRSRAGERLLLLGTMIVVAAVASLATSALLINIFQHKQEAVNPFYRVVE